jgi:hypothetical protein
MIIARPVDSRRATEAEKASANSADPDAVYSGSLWVLAAVAISAATYRATPGGQCRPRSIVTGFLHALTVCLA